MEKNLKRTILALAVAVAVFTAGILVPAASNADNKNPSPQAVAFFLPPLIEGS